MLSRHRDGTTVHNRKHNRDKLLSLDKEYVKQYKKLKSSASVREFTSTSTIHGIQHIFREGETPLHRFIWTILFSICLSAATYLIYDSWEGYITVPIAVTVSDTNYPLDEVYFAAVSVCPTSKIVRSQAIEYLSRKLGNWVTEDRRIDAFLEALSALQHPLYHNVETYMKEVGDEVVLKLEKINITDLMITSLPSCDALFYHCYWQGQQKNCCSIFSYQRSEEGFCYSFNSFTSETNKNCIYRDRSINNTNCTLLSTANMGSRSGLELFLRPQYKCTVRVHHPNEYPEAGMGLSIPIGNLDKMNVGIKPAITETSDLIRVLTPEEVGCYFKDTQYSAITRIYSQKSCLLECRMKYLLKECKCLPYYITMKISSLTCNASQLECIVKHKDELRFYIPPSDSSKVSDDVKKKFLDCTHCLPTCNERVYDLAIDYTKDTSHNKNGYNAYIDVYYRTSSVVRYTKDMTYNYVQLLVNLGGIGGLFLGGSVISILEAVYWFSRAFLTYWYPVNNDELKSVKQTQVKNVINEQAWLN